MIPLACPYCGAQPDCACWTIWGDRQAQVQCACGYRGRVVSTMDKAVREHNRIASMAGRIESKPLDVVEDGSAE